MITAEQEYRAAYERGLAGLPFRGCWNAEHMIAAREGYAEGVSHAEYKLRTESRGSDERK